MERTHKRGFRYEEPLNHYTWINVISHLEVLEKQAYSLIPSLLFSFCNCRYCGGNPNILLQIKLLKFTTFLPDNLKCKKRGEGWTSNIFNRFIFFGSL